MASVLLLLVTVWMFAVDHRRPWKRIQRTSDRIEAQVTEWRKLQVLTDDVLSQRERLQQALSELQSKELPATCWRRFATRSARSARRRDGRRAVLRTTWTIWSARLKRGGRGASGARRLAGGASECRQGAPGCG